MTRVLLAAALPIFGVLTSCGGSAGSGPATAEGLEKAARKMMELALNDPAELYEYMSADCKASMTRAEYRVKAALGKAMLDTMFEGVDVTIGDVTTRNVTATEGEAAVEVRFDGEAMGSADSYEKFVYEDGAWRTTDCDAASGGDGAAGTGEASSGADAAAGEEMSTIDDAGQPPETVGGELRSSDAVLADEAVQGVSGQFGSPVALEGVGVTVSSPAVGTDDVGPWLEVDVRVENRRTESLSLVAVELFCAGNPEGGGWQYESTFDPMETVPSGSYSEGTMRLLLPGDDQMRGTRPTCEKPARIVVSPWPSSWDDLGSAVFEVDPSLIDELNV
jgi:hypothetical protein